MSDPRRYLDDERAEPLARKLLHSAEGDGLDDARAEAIARMFEASSEATASSVAEPALAKASALKWGLLAIAAIVATTGVVVARSEGAKPRVASGVVVAAPKSEEPASLNEAPVAPPPPPLNREVPAEPQAPAVPRARTASADEAVPVAMLPSAQPSARVVRASAAPTSAPAEATTDLAGEVRALEGVRSAIAERRVADARAGLAGYERAFSKKLLEKEARVLEIEMLLAEGRHAEAEALARAFLASSANSPYAARVRSLVANPRLP